MDETTQDQAATEQIVVHAAVTANCTRPEDIKSLRRISTSLETGPIEFIEGSITSAEIEGTTFNLVAYEGAVVLQEATTGEAA